MPEEPRQIKNLLGDLAESRGPSYEEDIRADERRKVAEEIRAIVDDSGPYPMDAWRAFKSRHKRLVAGDSVVAVLLAVADEIEGEARDSS
ncbi:hypothetical protein ACQP2T_63975 (plasmid) [Nonomuraea sp. CA-143628]|uniref:hypothetical protein n=1 Tax=Nonomuraea sp. CA-143628 TaxID=3239997 RepID=UPI003D950A00